MVPESVIQAVAAAPHSEIRNVLLAMWGLKPDLTPVDAETQSQAYKQLENILAQPQEIPFG